MRNMYFLLGKIIIIKEKHGVDVFFMNFPLLESKISIHTFITCAILRFTLLF